MIKEEPVLRVEERATGKVLTFDLSEKLEEFLLSEALHQNKHSWAYVLFCLKDIKIETMCPDLTDLRSAVVGSAMVELGYNSLGFGIEEKVVEV